MRERNVAGLLILAGLSACVGDTAVESQEAKDSVKRKMLFLSPGAVYGWAGGREQRGTSSVIYQDDFEVNVESDLIVFSPLARSYDSRYDSRSGSRSGGLRWSVLELDAKQEGFRQRITTDLGLIVFHRPAGSRQAWRPLVCGDEDPDDLPSNGIQFFTPDTVINLAAQTVKTDEGQVRFRDCGIGAQRGGTSNAVPEFAAYVIARKNWFNMEGDFDYRLEASCDRGSCPRDDADYEAGGVMLDYPGAANWQDPYRDDRYRDDRYRDDRYRDDRYRDDRYVDSGRERCDNTYDDDGDRLTDCADPDCAGQWNGRSYCSNDRGRGESCECYDEYWDEYYDCSCVN